MQKIVFMNLSHKIVCLLYGYMTLLEYNIHFHNICSTKVSFILVKNTNIICVQFKESVQCTYIKLFDVKRNNAWREKTN